MKTVTCSRWLLLLFVLKVGRCGGRRIDGVAGQSVTLPCKYDLKTQGSSAVCWGRGAIPTYGCSDQIIATDGTKVREETRRSNRYQLLGKLDHGDVSLTILNATERDSGQYGCRVQVSGWFNDEKYHIELTITKAPATISPSESVTSTQHTPSNHIEADHVTSTDNWLTSCPHAVQADEEESSSGLTVVLVCVVLVLVALITVVSLIIIGRRWKKLNKMLQMPQQSASTMRFSSSSSSLRLHSRASAVENIYQLEGINDYEDCP